MDTVLTVLTCPQEIIDLTVSANSLAPTVFDHLTSTDDEQCTNNAQSHPIIAGEMGRTYEQVVKEGSNGIL